MIRLPISRLASAVAAPLVFLVSCQELPTRPLSEPEVLRSSHSTRDALDSPSSRSVSLSIANEAPLNGGEAVVGDFPYPTVVQMTASQAIGIKMTDGSPGSGFLGLGGRFMNDSCTQQGEAYLSASIMGGWNGCSIPDPYGSSWSGTVVVQGQVKWGYYFDSACPFPDYACGTYDGSSSVSLSRMDANLDLGVDPNRASLGASPAGHGYMFRATVTPNQLGPYTTPFNLVDGWTFTSADGVRALDCFEATCPQAFYASGTLRLDAIVNGVRMTRGPIAVTVVQPTLALALSKSVATVGDTLEVTTTVTPDPTATGERVDWQNFFVLAERHYGDGGGVVYSRRAAQGTPNGARQSIPASVRPTADSGRPAVRLPAAVARVSAAPRDNISAPAGSLRASEADGLTYCGTASVFPRQCYLVLGDTGNLTITVEANYNRRPISGSKLIRVNPAKVVSVQATGPNQGSFLAGIGNSKAFRKVKGEDKIALTASVPDPALGLSLTWAVSDFRDDDVLSPLPASVAPGLASSFLVPAPGKQRFKAPHPYALRKTALGYDVRGSAGGVTSDMVPVRQDVIDVERQEYIDFNVPQLMVPARSSFGPSPYYQGGDYAFAVRNSAFDALLAKLQAAWAPRQWTVNSLYRNPGHNAYHVNKGKSSGTVSGSWHQYGCAADIQTSPALAPNSVAKDTAAAQEFWASLQAKAVKLGFVTEARDPAPAGEKWRPSSGVGHVHVEIKCHE